MRLPAAALAVAAVLSAGLSTALAVSSAVTPAPVGTPAAVDGPAPLRSVPSTWGSADDIWAALHGHGLDCPDPTAAPARGGTVSALTCGAGVAVGVYRDPATADRAYAAAGRPAAAGLQWVVSGGDAVWVARAARLLGGRFRPGPG